MTLLAPSSGDEVEIVVRGVEQTPHRRSGQGQAIRALFAVHATEGSRAMDTDSGVATIERTKIAELAATVSGPVLLPDDDGYAAARAASP